MLIGYARVSTDEQNLSLQRDALNKAGCKRIFTDTASGAPTKRPGLADALSHLRKGDSLVVWKLDRLGRSSLDPSFAISRTFLFWASIFQRFSMTRRVATRLEVFVGIIRRLNEYSINRPSALNAATNAGSIGMSIVVKSGALPSSSVE
jgi:hypothetical protein